MEGGGGISLLTSIYQLFNTGHIKQKQKHEVPPGNNNNDHYYYVIVLA